MRVKLGVGAFAPAPAAKKMAPTAVSAPQRSTLVRMASVLFAFGAAMLLLEASSLDYLSYGSSFFHTQRTAHREDLLDLYGESDDTATATLPQWMQTKNSGGDVPSDELLHLSLLHTACLSNADNVIPWTYGMSGEHQESDAQKEQLLLHREDPSLLEKLRQCPDVDLFVPAEIRNHGYCEDAVVYAKFLESRLLPQWASEIPLFDAQRNRTVTYHDLCPRTPMLFFNHYWNGMLYSPSWPKQKPVYLMPNIEMYELNERHYWRVDAVLCKTRECEQRLSRWYIQEGNPRNTKVFYTRHSSSDVANFARRKLGADALHPKDYVHARFVHTVGTSDWKGTRQVLDCWLSRPEFPQLDLFVEEHAYKQRFETQYGDRILASRHVNLTSHRMNPITFGKVIAEASFFLCPSVMEGYGHYINQALASGGVIITTNVPPMNELIVSPDSGVYVKASPHQDSNMFLCGAYKGRRVYNGRHGLRNVHGMSAEFTSESVCDAVEHVLYKTSVAEREVMAANARRQYHLDTKVFARNMRNLRRFARQHDQKDSNDTKIQ